MRTPRRRRPINVVESAFTKREARLIMLYRLNLYRDDKLLSTELLQDVSLVDAKVQATSAIESGGADRAQLYNNRGGLAFNYPLAEHGA